MASHDSKSEEWLPLDLLDRCLRLYQRDPKAEERNHCRQADTERSLRLGEFIWQVMGAALPSNPVKHFAGSAKISQGRTNSIGKIL